MSVLHSKLPHKSSCTHTHRARHTVKGIIYSQNWKVWYSLACIGIVHTVNKPSHRLHVVTMFDLNAQPPHQTWDHFKFVVQQAWNKTGGLVYRSSWQRSIPYRAWAAYWRFLRLSKRTMFALSLYFVYLWFFFYFLSAPIWPDLCPFSQSGQKIPQQKMRKEGTLQRPWVHFAKTAILEMKYTWNFWSQKCQIVCFAVFS